MAPEFISPNVTTISENIPLNTIVMTIKAIDKDEGRNGYVEYFMTPDHETNGYFSLGNVDGILRATGKLDRELKLSYTIIVTAKDRGDPPNVTKTKIKINILDENDNSPVFDPKQYSASVPENASIGASVLQVSRAALFIIRPFQERYSSKGRRFLQGVIRIHAFLITSS